MRPRWFRSRAGHRKGAAGRQIDVHSCQGAVLQRDDAVRVGRPAGAPYWFSRLPSFNRVRPAASWTSQVRWVPGRRSCRAAAGRGEVVAFPSERHRHRLVGAPPDRLGGLLSDRAAGGDQPAVHRDPVPAQVELDSSACWAGAATLSIARPSTERTARKRRRRWNLTGEVGSIGRAPWRRRRSRGRPGSRGRRRR